MQNRLLCIIAATLITSGLYAQDMPAPVPPVDDPTAALALGDRNTANFWFNDNLYCSYFPGSPECPDVVVYNNYYPGWGGGTFNTGGGWYGRRGWWGGRDGWRGGWGGGGWGGGRGGWGGGHGGWGGGHGGWGRGDHGHHGGHHDGHR